jgi:fumarylacetoacetate (FAA) hydrolase
VRLPVPRPRTIRDFYAFEAHVKAARARRGLDMVPEWYELPVFYFSNPNAIYGHGAEIPYPAATNALDFELEVAVVLGRGGRDIPVEEADEYIAGFTIMNDWSARDIQRKEMAVGLGPAKGKDFATSLGPWLVTPDELADRREPAPPRALPAGSPLAGSAAQGKDSGAPRGYHYRLEMVARIDGREVSRGNLADLYWTFAEMIAYASRDCDVYPHEVIGSGTVGTGCLLELGLPWLQPGQTVELEVERLGVLRNTIGRRRTKDEGRQARRPSHPSFVPRPSSRPAARPPQ